MIWSVAARFGRAGIWEMRLSDLGYWYNGHLEIAREEKALIEGGRGNG